MARIKQAVLGASLLLLLPGVPSAPAAIASQPRVTHLRLRLAIDDQKQSLEGLAEFRFTASGVEEEGFSFVQDGLAITKVETDPQPLRDYQVDGKSLKVRVAGASAGTPSRLRIYYRAQPKKGLFFHRTVTETGVPVEQVWQFDAWENWMPKPVDPDQLLTWELEAEVRPDWQVVSNGKLLSADTAGTRRVFHWRQSIPARFEGFTFAAGNFEIFKQYAAGRRFVHYVPKGVADAATVLRSLGRASQMLEAFSREFGPYPFGDYHQVVLWDYHPQGTEHLGLSCLSENKLIEERSQLDADDYIVAHELSHDWWAVLVAAKSRAHIWLSEGFAVYFGNQFFEVAEGRDDFEYRLRRRLRLYLDEDRKYRRVLVSDEPVPGELDEHIYSKGAYILHMLRRFIGDERFFAGLRRYAEEHAYGRADSADLQRAMEAAAGQPLDWYFRQWLYQKGHPAFKVTRQWDEKSGTLTLRVDQVQDASAGLYRVPVRIQIVTGHGTETYREVLSEQSEVRHYQIKGHLRYVRFDAENSLLATVEFPRPAEELIRQLEGAEDAMGRIEAVEALASAPGMGVPQALERALRLDLFHGVRSAAAAALSRRGDASVPVLLKALGAETDSRVLQSVVGALEPFAAKADVQTALKQVALSASSPYVRARALLALARTKANGTFALLTEALGQNAHRDILRATTFQGFAALGDARALPEIIVYLRSNRTTRWAREPAVEALGKLGKGDQQVIRLLGHIRENDFWPGVREAASRALQ